MTLQLSPLISTTPPIMMENQLQPMASFGVSNSMSTSKTGAKICKSCSQSFLSSSMSSVSSPTASIFCFLAWKITERKRQKK